MWSLEVSLNSHPYKYESFKKEYKVVAVDGMTFDLIYLNYGNKMKTEKKWEDLRSWEVGWVPWAPSQTEALTAKVSGSGSTSNQAHA